MRKENKELDEFKDALWDYAVEHCDITDNGAFFVKFHTKSKSQLIGHINSRISGYHRKDTRSNFSNDQKERDAEARKLAHESRKVIKAQRHKEWKERGWTKKNSVLSLEEQRKAIALMRRERDSVIHRWLGRIIRFMRRGGTIVKSVVVHSADTDSISLRSEGNGSGG